MKITTKFMLALAMVGSLFLTSCKDYDDDNYNNALISSKLLADALQKQIDDLNLALEQKKCTCPEILHNANQNLKDGLAALANGDLQSMKDQILANNQLALLAENDSIAICMFFGTDNTKDALDKIAKGATLKGLNDALADSCKMLLDSVTHVAQNVKVLGDSIGAVDAAYKAADEILGNKIDSLGKIVDSLADARAKQITGVIVQQVYNPAFGSVNGLMSNIQSNVLVVYNGEIAAATKFPMAFADAQQITVKAGAIKNDSNKIYVTINPNTVDFTGFKALSLVNSQDEECAMKITDLKKSDAVLMSGWTRAAENGFYEANVTLPEGADQSKLNLTFDNKAIANAAKDLVQNHNGASVKEMASQLLKAIDNINGIEALGIKCAWADKYGDHAVYSNYNLAAVAVKPLGFTALDGVDTDQYFDKAKNFINKTYKKVVDKICDNLDATKKDYVEKLAARAITKIDYSGTNVIVTVNTKDDKGNVISTLVTALETAGATKVSDSEYSLPLSITDSNAIVTAVAANDIYNLTQMANDLIKTINDYEAKLQGTKITDKLISYVDKVKKVFDKAKDQILKPQLFINSDKGFAFAGIEGAASVATGSVELVPTTTTLGVVTPVYKKYIRVKDASNNVILEKIYNGEDKAGKNIVLSGLTKGQKYTVDYSALDFEGKEVANTYAFIYE